MACLLAKDFEAAGTKHFQGRLQVLFVLRFVQHQVECVFHILESLPCEPDVLFGVCRVDLREKVHELVAARLRLKHLVQGCEVLFIKRLILHR